MVFTKALTIQWVLNRPYLSGETVTNKPSAGVNARQSNCSQWFMSHAFTFYLCERGFISWSAIRAPSTPGFVLDIWAWYRVHIANFARYTCVSSLKQPICVVRAEFHLLKKYYERRSLLIKTSEPSELSQKNWSMLQYGWTDASKEQKGISWAKSWTQGKAQPILFLVRNTPSTPWKFYFLWPPSLPSNLATSQIPTF